MARNDSFRVRWASNPAQFERPQTSLIERGWAGGANEDPPEAKWENWWHNRVDEALAELEAYGALRWFADVPYTAGAVVRHGGKLWQALKESEGVEPGESSDEGHWSQKPVTPQELADELSPLLSGLVPRGHIAGLRVSNNGADPNNDVDIAPGECADSTATYWMRLESTLTKRLDAAWAQGSGQGGLFSGSKAPETTYYLFLIRRDSDGAIDAGFDTDPNAANRPAGWSAYAPVWELAVHTDDSGNLWQFTHNGDEAIVYPNKGSAASPANVERNSRYVVPSPFPTRNVMLHPELYYDSQWITISPGLAQTGSRASAGLLAGQEGNQIIVQTGTAALIADNLSNLSTAENPVASGTTPFPCRVKVWKSKGAI